MAAGGAVTHWPNFKLWAQEVNDRGGLQLKAGQRKVELIEYDDRSQPAEAIKAGTVAFDVETDNEALILQICRQFRNMTDLPHDCERAG